MSDMLMLFFVTIGMLFDLFGVIGLIRLPDIYNRLQAATKCVTLGTCMILLGVFCKFGISGIGMKALLCAWFILLTTPAGAHAIARASHRSGVPLWKGSIMDKYREDQAGAEDR